MRQPAHHPRRLVWLLAVLGALSLALIFVRSHRVSDRASGSGALEGAAARELVKQLTALEAREQEVAETVWAKELLAEQCGRVFEELWDSVNRTTNKLVVAAAFPFERLVVPKLRPAEPLGHGIFIREPDSTGVEWTHADWERWLGELGLAGWRVEQVEFRHNQFDVDSTGKPLQSRFQFTAHLVNPSSVQRAALTGDLIVDWSAGDIAGRPASARRVDASHLTLQTRAGDPPFRRVFMERIAPPEKSFFIDPLIVCDLDGDGISEIILAARNLVFRHHGDWNFKPEPLCRYPFGPIFSAVIADFDGDGLADFLCADFEGLTLFKGSPRGTFDEPGRRVWSAAPHLKYGQVLTCGDINGDGSLDVWLGQYKNPYERGQMPTPYYDANDGNPSYLLMNDGHGGFRDMTDAAGLGSKRWRRCYSASLVDLDGDGHLDLFVVSDFGGIDVYLNDGKGRFTDATKRWIPQARGFGMGHTFADFNADGRADVFVTGMHCPTALRLAHLGLVRPGRSDYAAMIPAMASGNHLLLGRESGFGLTPLNTFVAHSGWSWGSSALDFDNDGFPDLYVANGHETRDSVRDYDSEFWLHDIYVGNSTDSLVASAYFRGKFARTRGQGQSYGGYEKNRLFWNRHAAGFVEVAYLMGLALQQDSRNVVAEDLDADGRVDLVTTTFEVWPEAVQTLQVFRNELTDPGHWIGIRSRDVTGRRLPPGTSLVLRYPGGRSVQERVTGDSHRAQQSGLVHFGLGSTRGVEALVLRLPNRASSISIPVPDLDRYLELPPEVLGSHP